MRERLQPLKIDALQHAINSAADYTHDPKLRAHSGLALAWLRDTPMCSMYAGAQANRRTKSAPVPRIISRCLFQSIVAAAPGAPCRNRSGGEAHGTLHESLRVATALLHDPIQIALPRQPAHPVKPLRA